VRRIERALQHEPQHEEASMSHARTAIVLAVAAGALALTAAVAPTADDNTAPAATQAAAVAYLRIDGIEGGSAAARYEGWMDVAAFEWNVSSTAGAVAGATRTTAAPEFGPITVLKPVDKATPMLAQACASGRSYPEAELVFFAAGSTQPIGRVTLADVRIVESASAGGDMPAPEERLSLSFGRVEWTYVDLDPNTGRPRGEVKAGWDVAANRPM
jgi:type VI secretion system secreted protein Hcp